MFGFGKTKKENEKLKRENSILKKVWSDTKNENIKLKKENKQLASDGLRHGSSKAGRYMRNERKN